MSLVAQRNPLDIANEVAAMSPDMRRRMFSRQTAANYLRARRRLLPVVARQLRDEDAPWHVIRWVAWAPDTAQQSLRVRLILHLRHHIERKRDGWHQDRERAAALRVLDEARAEARRVEAPCPQPDDIPADRYAEAIESAAQQAPRPRRRAEAPSEAAPLTPAEQRRLRLLLGKLGIPI